MSKLKNLLNTLDHTNGAKMVADLKQVLPMLLATENPNGHWVKFGEKFLNFLETGKPAFSIFTEGNSKLPFLSFSSMPFISCRGMGSCEDFCYSIKAWRYPAAFFRMLQNFILLQTYNGREYLLSALIDTLDRPKFKALERVDFRLYVDGDFNSEFEVGFWFSVLMQNPKLRAYGYSKSFAEILAYFENGYTAPENYVLNVSSGHKHTSATVEQVKALPITRGDFIAVKISDKNLKPKTREYREAVKTAHNGNGFVCPSKCGECLATGHACGIKSISKPILIAVH